VTTIPRASETQGAETSAIVADQLAVILAAIDAGDLVAPAATRHRIQGAALALGVLAGRPGNDRLRDILKTIRCEEHEQQ
jgi:hypothetical protein